MTPDWHDGAMALVALAVVAAVVVSVLLVGLCIRLLIWTAGV